MSALLSKAASLCESHQKIIVSEEKNRKHTAKNLDLSLVRHYKIDGDVITDISILKCDYLVLNDSKKTAYFIELKSSGKFNEARQQIHSTIEKLRQELPGYIYHGRIIAKSVSSTQKLYATKEITHRRKYKGEINYNREDNI